jgi:hypothetical protein
MDIVDFLKARLVEREKALSDLASRRLAEAVPAIEMQQHAAIQIVARYPLHGMPHYEYEAFQELLRGIQAKRRIVETCRYWLHEDDRGVDPCAQGVLAGLAAEWSTHPEYRTEWTP